MKLVSRMIAATACALLLIALPARADRLRLPGQLVEIGEDAFSGDTSLTEVEFAEGVLAIGDRAFFGCESLGLIRIPLSVQAFGEGFLDGCAGDILILTEPDSFAAVYARNHCIDYQADTTYRALLICQSYPDSAWLALKGPDNDAVAMSACLGGFASTPYQVSVEKNLTADDMLAAIDDAFASATADDVSLLYFSGHGCVTEDDDPQGAFVGITGDDFLTAGALRAAMDLIPGRKIVIIDACYSGNMLASQAPDTQSDPPSALRSTGAAQDDPAVEAFIASFMQAFNVKKRGGLVGNDYFVLTSAAKGELSYDNDFNGTVLGVFTYNLTAGCGYDPVAGILTSAAADVNNNDVITFQEIYQYTRKKSLVSGQHVQVYPGECNWFGILRQ